MEVLAIIGGLFVAWMLLGFTMSSNQESRYNELLDTMLDSFYQTGYKTSELHRKRVAHINAVGLSSALLEIVKEARFTAVNGMKLNPALFQKSSIQTLEDKYILAYAMAHGKGNDFQRIYTLGGEIQQAVYGR